MLTFIGIGIYGNSGLSQRAIAILAKCDLIYVERFTSLISNDDIQELRSLFSSSSNKQMVTVKRWFVEDGREILEEAKDRNVALLSYGDPMIATTFMELRLRAMDRNVKVEVVYGASGVTSLISECGLQIYKIGRIVTMMEESHSAISVYNSLSANLQLNCHTLILTEYRYDEDHPAFFLDPKQVILRLLEVEKDIRCNIITVDSFLIVASRVGTNEQKILSGKVSSLLRIEYGQGPHSLLFPAKLHFIEEDGITNLTENLDLPSDNTASVDNTATRMIKKYVPMIRDEIKRMRSQEAFREYNKEIIEMIDNAEYYVDDAINFMDQGKSELAILSIGYADGLVDSLKSVPLGRRANKSNSA